MTTLSLVSILIGGAVLLSNGLADPPRADHLIIDESHNIEAGWNPNSRLIQSRIFTLEGVAALGNFAGEWGIWVQDMDGGRVVAAINGYGFVTARRCAPDTLNLTDCPTLTEPTQGVATRWIAFPHLQDAPAENRLRLHYPAATAASALELRLNNEWMWDIPLDLGEGAIIWGLWTSQPSHNVPLRVWTD